MGLIVVAEFTLAVKRMLLVAHKSLGKYNVQWSVHPKYIPIYIQQDAMLHSLFISGNCSICFGWYFHPSS